MVDLSARQGLRFWAGGDGRGYQVMLFSQSRGRVPLSQGFTAGPAWQEHAFKWSSFSGYDGHDVQAVVFAAVLPPGPFAFRLAGSPVGGTGGGHTARSPGISSFRAGKPAAEIGGSLD